jgi:TetR/AcrR family transcriptional regulator, transcriptional repressor for nem operon
MHKGELTRQRIIAEAAVLFNQRGFTGCSMQDVMEATGLEKGGLYRHFTCKEDLAVEAFKYSLDKVRRARFGEDTDISDAIPLLLYKVRQFVRVPSPLPGGCPIMNTAIDADDGNPTLLHLAHQAVQEWKDGLRAIVEQGIRSGEIKPDAQPGRIANLIVSTLEGALMISRLENTRHAILDAEETLCAFILDLAPNAERSPKPTRRELGTRTAQPAK